MKIEIKSVIHAGLEAAMFAKRHIHALLFVVLITVICVWGFIFGAMDIRRCLSVRKER